MFTVASTFTQVGDAYDDPDHQPWIGIWWPALVGSGRRNLYDGDYTSALAPLAKYDAYSRLKYGSNPGTQHEEVYDPGTGLKRDDYHYTEDPDKGWIGHCHAWSASSICEVEPRAAMTITFPSETLNFAVGDLKGLLAAAYDNYLLHPEPEVGPYWGTNGDNPAETADGFHHYITCWLRGHHQPVIGDVKRTDEKWFHPFYKYVSSMKADPTNRLRIRTETTMYFLDYAGDPNDLTPEPPAPVVMASGIRYWLTYDISGGIVTGTWIDEGDRPDYMLAPMSPNDPGCGGVTLTRVHEILTAP